MAGNLISFLFFDGLTSFILPFKTSSISYLMILRFAVFYFSIFGFSREIIGYRVYIFTSFSNNLGFNWDLRNSSVNGTNDLNKAA